MTSPAPITVVSGAPFAHEEPKTSPDRLDAEPDPDVSAVASGLGYVTAQWQSPTRRWPEGASQRRNRAESN
jgi:hypothetical protein